MGGTINQNDDSYWDYITDKGKKYEVVLGEIENGDNIVYDSELSEDTELIGTRTCFNACTEAGVRHANLEASKENGVVIAKEGNATTPGKVLSLKEAESEMLLPVYKDKSRKFIFSLYLEGWDEANTNFVRYAGFHVKLSLKIVQPIL